MTMQNIFKEMLMVLKSGLLFLDQGKFYILEYIFSGMKMLVSWYTHECFNVFMRFSITQFNQPLNAEKSACFPHHGAISAAQTS